MPINKQANFQATRQKRSLFMSFFMGSESDDVTTYSNKTLVRRKRASINSQYSKVSVSLNNQQCRKEGRECFNSAAGAADYFGARYATGTLKTGYDIVSVGYKPSKSKQTPMYHLIAAAGAVIVAGFVVVVVLTKKLKRQRGKLWVPEGFQFLAKKARRREPIGSADFSLKVFNNF